MSSLPLWTNASPSKARRPGSTPHSPQKTCRISLVRPMALLSQTRRVLRSLPCRYLAPARLRSFVHQHLAVHRLPQPAKIVVSCALHHHRRWHRTTPSYQRRLESRSRQPSRWEPLLHTRRRDKSTSKTGWPPFDIVPSSLLDICFTPSFPHHRRLVHPD
jgi:hypothetical protein